MGFFSSGFSRYPAGPLGEPHESNQSTMVTLRLDRCRGHEAFTSCHLVFLGVDVGVHLCLCLYFNLFYVTSYLSSCVCFCVCNYLSVHHFPSVSCVGAGQWQKRGARVRAGCSSRCVSFLIVGVQAVLASFHIL